MPMYRKQPESLIHPLLQQWIDKANKAEKQLAEIESHMHVYHNCQWPYEGCPND